MSTAKQMICPKCRGSTLSVSGYTSFFHCENCGWKGLRPIYRKPVKYISQSRSLGAVFLIVALIEVIGITDFFEKPPTILISLTAVAGLLLVGPLFFWFVWSAPESKWRLGKMPDSEFAVATIDDLKTIISESTKYIERGRNRNWVIFAVVVLFGFGAGFILHIVLLIAITYIVGIVAIPNYLFSHWLIRRLSKQNRRLETRVSELSALEHPSNNDINSSGPQ